MSEGNTILSVAKAMHLLEVLSEARQPLSLTELHRRTGWPRSTIFGLLNTMRDYRVVSQAADGKYALGLRLFEFGCSVLNARDISAVARPYMSRLCSEIEGSAVLSICDGGHVMALDQVEGHGGFRVVLEIGGQLPLHCTSQGKLFLANMTPAASGQLLHEMPLPLYTPHTLTEPEQIRRELEQIRQNGYALEDGEYKIGLRSVSAPVYDLSGQLQYALTVVGMFRRIRSEEFTRAIALTCAAAWDISVALGYQIPIDKPV